MVTIIANKKLTKNQIVGQPYIFLQVRCRKSLSPRRLRESPVDDRTGQTYHAQTSSASPPPPPPPAWAACPAAWRRGGWGRTGGSAGSAWWCPWLRPVCCPGRTGCPAYSAPCTPAGRTCANHIGEGVIQKRRLKRSSLLLRGQNWFSFLPC